MAARWSNENPLKTAFLRNASALALDCTGQLALLAGRLSFDIVKLDYLPAGGEPVCVPRKSKVRLDVSTAEWNPHRSHSLDFAIASNQVAEIYTSSSDEWTLDLTLKAHTRVISDLNWSGFDPFLLATCSVDTYTYLWDTREPKKPCMEFSAIAGAGQVKWNKKNGDIIATVHEGGIRLWDKRKGNQTVQCISAHPSKIHGLDWSPTEENHLATAAQDGTAKIWDIADSGKLKDGLRTESPLWRIRYAPFGDGILTLMLPQICKVDKMLFLWSQSNLSSHVFSFTGHEDNILDFAWRKMNEGASDYQLVTWSRDKKLFVWRVEPHIQRLCGVETPDILDMHHSTSGDLEGLSAPPSLSLSSGTGTPTHGSLQNGHGFLGDHPPMDGPSLTPDEPRGFLSLEQELERLTIPVPDVMVDKIDKVNRTCLLICTNNRSQTELMLIFPDVYPLKAIPQFVVVSSNCIRDSITQDTLIKSLQDICLFQVETGQPCIEACIKQFSALMGGIVMSDRSQNVIKTKSVQPSRHTYGSMYDTNIPFPKTCGARFCGVDKLIVFSRPNIAKKNLGFHGTPKALSALSESTISAEVPSLGTYYKDRERKQKRTARHRRKSNESSAGQSISRSSLVVCDVSLLLPIHHNLAENYKILLDDIPLMCSQNTKAAAAVGRSDLVQTWSMVAHASVPNLSPSDNPDKTPWAHHPFGRSLITSLFEHYCNIHDVQMLAMLCCMFKPYILPKAHEPVYKQYPLRDSGDSAFKRQWSSSSLSSVVNISVSDDNEDDYKFNIQRNPKEAEMAQHHNSKQLLDPLRAKQFDQFLLAYAEILFRWQLLGQRAQVLQRLTHPSRSIKDMLHFSDLMVTCSSCNKRSPSIICDKCRRYKFHCSICHLVVKGSSSFCLYCGHGGHVTHMMDWFQAESFCPTGCGCECAIRTKEILDNNITMTTSSLV